MSNIINSSVLTMNKGTAKSGWWNPDHAARMGAKSSSIKLDRGNKEAYCHAGLMASSLLKAASQAGFHGSFTESGKTAKISELRKEADKNKALQSSIVESKDGRTVSKTFKDDANSGGDGRVGFIYQAANHVFNALNNMSDWKSKDGKFPKTLAEDANEEIQDAIHFSQLLAKQNLYVKDNQDKLTPAAKAVNSMVASANEYLRSLPR